MKRRDIKFKLINNKNRSPKRRVPNLTRNKYFTNLRKRTNLNIALKKTLNWYKFN